MNNASGDGLLVSRRYTERERLKKKISRTVESEEIRFPEKKEKPEKLEYFCSSSTARCLMTLCSQDSWILDYCAYTLIWAILYGIMVFLLVEKKIAYILLLTVSLVCNYPSA